MPRTATDPGRPGSPPLATGTVAGYAAGSVATGAFGTVPGLLLLPYLTDTVGLSALLAGLVVFAPKAWDVVLNPVAGRISDRSRDPRGPRRPFLLRAGLALAVCFALLFAAPELGRAGETVWVLVLFLACATAYAFFQVPFVALPAEMTDDPQERTRVMAWRVALLALAILLTGASAPAIRDAVGGREGYRVMGVAVALVIAAGALAAYHGTRRLPVRRVSADPGTLRAQLRVVAGAGDFRALLATFVVQAVAVGVMLAGVDYVARVVLQRPGAATLLFVCFVGPALLVTPLWERVGRRLGKRGGYLVSSLLLAGGAVVLVGAPSLPLAVTYAATALVGIGYAGAQVFPLAMLPDTVAADERRTGLRRAGIFTGVWTAAETLGLAVGPAVFAVVLVLGGYVSSRDDATVVQPDSAVDAVTLGFSLLPALLVLASLVFLRAYRLDDRAPTPTRHQEDA